MALKRWIFAVLTLMAIVFISGELWSSLNQPQFQSRLELYQTNLLLHATEWKPETDSPGLALVQAQIVKSKPIQNAAEQYQEAERTAVTSIEKLQTQLQAESNPQVIAQLNSSIRKLENLAAELNLRLGVLQATQGEVNAALQTWQQVTKDRATDRQPLAETAQVLIGLWSNPPQLLPDAEAQIQKGLDSWFRYQALSRLYQLQERQNERVSLQVAEQAVAQEALSTLILVTSLPVLPLLVGSGLLLFWVGRWLVQTIRSKQATQPLEKWQVPWDGDTIVQVLVIGFVFVGQLFVGRFLLRFALTLLGVNPALLGVRSQAFLVLVGYLLLTVSGLLVLYLSIKPFFPLPEDWFRFDWRGSWVAWGFAGYCVAYPIVLIVARLNQLIWQGQGGSNPILPIALENKDSVAFAIFVVTASIAAPIFEEILFRGFLLPSLTRYLPVWGAIAVSSLLFAIAHFSLSEILPLAALGMVLGYVYVRSRNLLASMLLHSLWNGGTLLTLFILGRGSS